MSNFNDEQANIIRILRSTEVGKQGRKWSKFNGDIACRLVKAFAERHLPTNTQVVGPNAFVEGNPTEWDILLVDAGVQPLPYTNSYPLASVRGVIEVKSEGHVNRSDPTNLLEKFNVLGESSQATCIYITLRETTKTKKASSRNYLREMKDALEPRYKVFCLADVGTLSKPGELINDQWEKFIQTLKGQNHDLNVPVNWG